jgi:hypothetical protein
VPSFKFTNFCASIRSDCLAESKALLAMSNWAGTPFTLTVPSWGVAKWPKSSIWSRDGGESCAIYYLHFKGWIFPNFAASVNAFNFDAGFPLVWLGFELEMVEWMGLNVVECRVPIVPVQFPDGRQIWNQSNQQLEWIFPCFGGCHSGHLTGHNVATCGKKTSNYKKLWKFKKIVNLEGTLAMGCSLGHWMLRTRLAFGCHTNGPHSWKTMWHFGANSRAPCPHSAIKTNYLSISFPPIHLYGWNHGQHKNSRAPHELETDGECVGILGEFEEQGADNSAPVHCGVEMATVQIGKMPVSVQIGLWKWWQIMLSIINFYIPRVANATEGHWAGSWSLRLMLLWFLNAGNIQ